MCKIGTEKNSCGLLSDTAVNKFTDASKGESQTYLAIASEHQVLHADATVLDSVCSWDM